MHAILHAKNIYYGWDMRKYASLRSSVSYPSHNKYFLHLESRAYHNYNHLSEITLYGLVWSSGRLGIAAKGRKVHDYTNITGVLR
jgi:hypothetical protein